MTPEPLVYDRTGSRRHRGPPATAHRREGLLADGVLPLDLRTRSAACPTPLVVSGAHTDTGNPIAVFGPQTGYFAPQLLMLQELQGPGISARGVSFAGLDMYVAARPRPGLRLERHLRRPGHHRHLRRRAVRARRRHADRGLDALPLPRPCLPMEKLERTNSWKPTVADSTAGRLVHAGHATAPSTAWSSRRGTVGGKPVAFTTLRSTYLHEADSIDRVPDVQRPGRDRATPAAFQRAAEHVGYAFNWFYVGLHATPRTSTPATNPVRPAASTRTCPIKAERRVRVGRAGTRPPTPPTYTPLAQHPQVDQPGLLHQLEQQAGAGLRARPATTASARCTAATCWTTGCKAADRGRARSTRASLRQGHGRGGASTDLRGRAGAARPAPGDRHRRRSPTRRWPPRSTKLRDWQRSGAQRKETSRGQQGLRARRRDPACSTRGGRCWSQAQFKPGLGDGLYSRAHRRLQIDESPSAGSTALHRRRDGPGTRARRSSTAGGATSTRTCGPCSATPWPARWPRTYCGGGNARRLPRRCCWTASGGARPSPATTVYPGDDALRGGRPVVRRRHHPAARWAASRTTRSAGRTGPTYQQVVAFPAHRGDDVANLARGQDRDRVQHPVLPATRRPRRSTATRRTRWASASADNQWLQVDLGSAQTVGRVVLRWEAAYGPAYRIEVVRPTAPPGPPSTATTTGNGGVDNVTFSPATARYVRRAGAHAGHVVRLLPLRVGGLLPVTTSRRSSPGDGGGAVLRRGVGDGAGPYRDAEPGYGGGPAGRGEPKPRRPYRTS